MSRVHDAFAAADDRGGALIIYITAGDPSLDDTVEAVLHEAARFNGEVLAPLNYDRVLSEDMAAVAARVEDGSLVAAVEQAVGELE